MKSSMYVLQNYSPEPQAVLKVSK